MERFVVVHESKTGRLEDASVFGPFSSYEQASAFVEWAKGPFGTEYPNDRIPCDGRDMVKVVQPIQVITAFSFDYGDNDED